MDCLKIRNPGGRQALSEIVDITRLPCYAPQRQRAAASWGPGRTGKGRSASWTPGLGPAGGQLPHGIARQDPTRVTPPAPALRPGRGQAPDPLPGSPGERRTMTQHVEPAKGGANETHGGPAGEAEPGEGTHAP